MTFEEQVEIVRAAKDGRNVTYITMYDLKPSKVYPNHSFNFVVNTYFIEPIYKERSVIMVKTSPDEIWIPRRFRRMEGANVVCCEGSVRGSCTTFSIHRKQTNIELGE